MWWRIWEMVKCYRYYVERFMHMMRERERAASAFRDLACSNFRCRRRNDFCSWHLKCGKYAMHEICDDVHWINFAYVVFSPVRRISSWNIEIFVAVWGKTIKSYERQKFHEIRLIKEIVHVFLCKIDNAFTFAYLSEFLIQVLCAYRSKWYRFLIIKPHYLCFDSVKQFRFATDINSSWDTQQSEIMITTTRITLLYRLLCVFSITNNFWQSAEQRKLWASFISISLKTLTKLY